MPKLIHMTRTWIWIEMSKKKIMRFTDSDDVEYIETMLEFIFDNPPTVKEVGVSSTRQYAEIQFLLRTDILENILKQQVSVKQVEKYLNQNIVCEYSFKEYPQDIGILKALSSYDGKYTYINERYTYKHYDKQNDRKEYETKQVSKRLTHEHTHNFIRFFLNNTDMGLLYPFKFEIRIFKSIEDYENKKDFVESGDYFDYFVNNRKLKYNPYSLLIKRQAKLVN